MYKSKKSLLLIVLMQAFLITCNDDNIVDPPCIICPIDFRLTDFEATWSPDGKTIAYIHGDTVLNKTGIYLVDTSGSNKRILYPSPSAYSPSWSPDNNWIVFSMNAQIYKIKVTGDSLIQLTNESRNFFPSWCPDGEWIAYDSNKDSPNGMNFIWKMRTDGTLKTRIAYDPSNGEIRMPDYDALGDKIVHIRYLVGVKSSEIFCMSRNGGDITRLSFNDNTDYYPKYSCLTNKIAFTSQPEGSVPQIFIMDADGNNLKQLTNTQGYTCDWSPDEEWIVYTDTRSSSGRLWIIRKDGSGKHQLTF